MELGGRGMAGQSDARTDDDVGRVLSVGFGVLWLLDGALQFLLDRRVLTIQMMAMGGVGQPAWLTTTIDSVAAFLYLHGLSEAFALALGSGQALIGWSLLLGPHSRWGRLGPYLSMPTDVVMCRC